MHGDMIHSSAAHMTRLLSRLLVYSVSTEKVHAEADLVNTEYIRLIIKSYVIIDKSSMIVSR